MTAIEDHARSIFLAALERAPDQWAAFLNEACGDNAELRARVHQLLHAHQVMGSIHGGVVGAPAGTIDDPLREGPGTVIGPYKLLQQIGEGGMGTVFMAEQTHPVQRKVALKVIKAGMDSRQVIARFEAERQALAMMDHVNIARVLDAGTTSSDPGGVSPGRPYFVMELVHGVPITKYCDDNHLTPRERLELFVPVCQAIQHAHQKGIIHRDIKPSNVMITLYDGKPVPKVIDFGVAKATEQKLTERTLFTQYGTMVGTLEYMSPEQAEMSALGVDTRSDIYSLGVLLYELLTGNTPLSHKRVKEAAYAEILRMIKEEEPPKPSTRLSESGEALASISANRHTEPAKLSKLMRGELDWIVMKTLEKDRNRRYETANGFAMDVQRYLADEPVLACPPSKWYRFRKFARRNKRTLATAALFGILLVAAVGAVTGTVGWAVRDREAREQDLAQKAARDREAREQELARKAARDLEARQTRIRAQVDLILGEVKQLEKVQKWPEALAAARRAEARTADGADAATRDRVRQVLRDLEMVARLEGLRLKETPGAKLGVPIDAGSPRRYAAAFRAFGVDVEALPAEESAARLRARPAVAIALAASLDDWARAGRQRAPDHSKRLWALAAAVDPDPWRVSVRQACGALDVASLRKLAQSPKTARQPPQSQLLLASSLWLCNQPEQAITLLERACEIHPADFWIHYTVGRFNFLIRPARLEAAVRHDLAARALRPRSAAPWTNLGAALHHQGKRDEAIACLRKAIELDPKHAIAHLNLGNPLKDQGKLDEAIRHYRKAIELDPKFAPAYSNLGIALSAQGKRDEAIACHRKAIELDPKNARYHSSLGDALSVQGKRDEAIACYRKAIELDPKFAPAYSNLGIALRAQGKLDEAIACYRKAIELDPKFAPAYSNLGIALSAQGKRDEAIACYRKAIELDPKFAAYHSNLGITLSAQGKRDEAIACYRKAIELDPKNAPAYTNLGIVLSAQGKLDEAIACHRKAIELEPKNARLHSILGYVLRDQNKLDEAVACYRKVIELDPKYAGAHSNLAYALRAQNKPDEAIACLRKAIKLDPKNAGLHSILGDALRAQKKLDEAIACYRKVIELDPKYFGAHSNLANALRTQNKPDEAIACLRKAIKLDPKNAHFHITLGSALAQQGKVDEAIASHRRAIELDPKVSHALGSLVFYLGRVGKLDEAIAAFKQAIRLEPGNADYHFALGEALRLQKKLDEAIPVYRQAIQLKPQELSYRYTLGEMFQLQGKHPQAIAEYRQVVRIKPDDAGAHWILGTALRQHHQVDEALAEFRAAVRLQKEHVSDLAQILSQEKKWDEAIACFRKAIELHPNWSWTHQQLAWFLATCPEAKWRDSKQAVSLAKKAVELAPKTGYHLKTLGVALYRAGDWKAAAQALEKSMALPPGGESNGWYFLAMAHWRLGNRDEARKHYDRAVQWMNKNQPQNEELRRFRTEAAELLGLNEKK